MASVTLAVREAEEFAPHAELLEREGHRVRLLTGARSLIGALEASRPEVLVMDAWLRLPFVGATSEMLLSLLEDAYSETRQLWFQVFRENNIGRPSASWAGVIADSVAFEPHPPWQMALAVEQLLWREAKKPPLEDLGPALSRPGGRLRDVPVPERWFQPSRVVIAHPDAHLARQYAKRFLTEGRQVKTVRRWEAVVRCLAEGPPDLLVCSVLLGASAGEAFGQALREAYTTSNCRMLWLTRLLGDGRPFREWTNMPADSFVLEPCDPLQVAYAASQFMARDVNKAPALVATCG